MRVAFVINSLGYGGAERVLDILLRHAVAHLPDVKLDLIVLDDMDEVRAVPLEVERHCVGARGGLSASVMGVTGLLQRLRPDVAVSFLIRANVATALAGRLTGTPTIISERMQATRHFQGKYRGLERALAALPSKFSYRFADRVIAVSAGVRDDLLAHFGLSPDKVSVIANPFELETIARDGAAAPAIPLPQAFVVSSGRLERAKNFDGLIRAYLASGIDEHLVILGEGSERTALEALIASANASDRIHLPGYLENPFAVVSRAQFYASASRSEGFPNAMAEAMALGVPAISTDCLSGPAELLADVVKANPSNVMEAPYGMLVPEDDDDSLARAMRRMSAADTRSAYAVRSRSRMAKFASEILSRAYWDLITSRKHT